MADDTTKDTTQATQSSSASNDSGTSTATSSATDSGQSSEATNSQSSSTSSQSETTSSSSVGTSSAATESTPSTTNSTNGQSSTTTGSTATTDTTGSSLPKPEEQFPQERYRVTVHPEILASQAFKDAGFLPPRQYYNYNYDDPYIINDDPNYQWVQYKPKPGDTMFMFFMKYGVPVPGMRRWNPYSVAYNYEGETWKIRILASKLPHD